MAVSSEDLAVIDELAEEFVGRLRRGEFPSIQAYADSRPKLAAEINRLFPTLVAMEGMSSSTRTAPTQPAASTNPTKIGDYRIVRSLGAGGMGIVYEAIQESLGRHVALKILPVSARKSERFRERFRIEARAAARLQHPHIVPVYGVGEHEGVPYYAMQFISGRGLDELLQPRGDSPNLADETATLASRIDLDSTAIDGDVPISIERPAPNPNDVRWVAEIGAQVAGALSYAHGEGVIHRDIKPSNLILDQRGCVWVTDFGLAKITDADGLTEPGDIVGTIRYMAPERFNGWSDVRSDVYGLGATLYELLTRRPMYDDADRSRLIHAILNSEPPKPRKLNRAIPRDLETIVLKAIAREPGHRYPNADALEVDLKRFLEGRPILARRQTLTKYAWSWCRRKPLAAGMAVAVAVLLLVMLAGSLIVNFRLDGQNSQIVTQNQQISDAQAALKEQLNETNEAHAREAEAKVEARRQLMLALRREAQAARWSRQPGGREEALNAIQQLMALAKELPLTPEETLEVRNLSIAVSALFDVVPVKGSPSITGNVLFSPDLRHYVLAKEPGLIAYEYPSGREVARLAVIGLNSQLFSPDNKHIVVGADRGAKNGKTGEYLIWDWQSNKVVAQIPAVAGRAYYAIDGDGTQIAFARANGTLATYSLQDGRNIQTFPIGYQAQGLAYSPDGKRVALHRNSDQLEIWDLAEKKVHLKLSTPNGAGIMTIAWSANGRMLAAGCANYRAHVWRAENGQLASDLVGHQAEVTKLFFDPNGEWIATASWDSTTRFWNPVTGTPMLNLRGMLVGVSDDGRRLAHFSGQTTSLMQVQGLTEFHSLHGHLGAKGPWHASFSVDSSILATSSHDGIRIWDAALGRNIGELRPTGGALATAFHPKGGYLISAGRTHLSRWPISYENRGSILEIGAEEPMLAHQADPVNRGERRVALSSDGGRVAVSNQIRQCIFIFSFDEPALWRSIHTFHDMSGVLLSPDGKWVFSASWPIPNAGIWDAISGIQVRNLRRTSPVFASFRPDGRRFACATSQTGEILEVGTWKPVANIPPEPSGLKSSAIAYSPDSRMLAIVRGNNVIQLLDAESLREVARLEAPDPQGVAHLAFSPDGGRLAAVATTHVVHLWDLRRLRSRLSSLDLDWDHPAIPVDVKRDRELQVRVRGK